MEVSCRLKGKSQEVDREENKIQWWEFEWEAAALSFKRQGRENFLKLTQESWGNKYSG